MESKKYAKKYAIAMLKIDNEYYVWCGPKGSLSVRDTSKEMLDTFTAEYMRNSYSKTSSTAVLINSIQVQPSVLLMSLKDISDKLLDYDAGVKKSKIGNGGNFYALKCNGPAKIEEIFDSGRTPKLTFER